MRSVGWIAAALLGALVAMYAIVVLSVPAFRPPLVVTLAQSVPSLLSYALTFAAVTLRLWLPLSQIAGMPFIDAYQAVAWVCWVPNLLVVEWVVLRR